MSPKKNQDYVPLHTVEDSHNADISNSYSISSSMTGDIEAVGLLHARSNSRKQEIQVQLKLGRVASFLIGIGITLCIALLVFSSILWQELNTLRQVEVEHQSGDSDRPVPSFGPTSHYWLPHPVLSGPPSKEADESWNTLMPDGRGFIPVKSARSGSGSTVYSISAYHQIHCLFMMKEQIALSLYPEIMSELRNSSETKKHSPNHLPSPEHLWHCVDYLREAIMCLADSTLEPLDDEGGGASGWHATHECRNWDALYDWAQEHGNDTTLTGIHG